MYAQCFIVEGGTAPGDNQLALCVPPLLGNKSRISRCGIPVFACVQYRFCFWERTVVCFFWAWCDRLDGLSRFGLCDGDRAVYIKTCTYMQNIFGDHVVGKLVSAGA